MVLLLATDLAVQVPRALDAGTARETRGVALARDLARFDRVALLDVGFLPSAAGLREVVDLGGLTDPAIGRLPGGHGSKQVEEAWLSAAPPDAIVLHSVVAPTVEEGRLQRFAGFPVEHRIAAMGFVREQYRVERVVPYAAAYWYVVLVRRS